MAYLDQLLLHEIEFEVTRSGGPGGQNVNRTNSAVILRWNVLESQSFTFDQRQRLLTFLAPRLTRAGELLIRSEESRDKEMNRKRCFEKLESILAEALFVPKKRKKTRPTRGSKERRHESKKQRSNIKSSRRKVDY
jgi:ribosome-associated protein